MSEKNLRATGDRIEALLEELQASGDSRIAQQGRELVRLLMELYGSGLGRILEIVAEEAADAGPVFDRFAADSLVASLLVLHGLHPEDTETRVRQALDRVRPGLASQGGDVTLLGVSDGVARLRLEGTCQGCGSSTVTMKAAVEKAIEEAAPEVLRLDFVGTAEPASAGSLIQIQPHRNALRAP